MKKVELTPEQKEQWKNIYIIYNQTMIPVVEDENINLTAENFKVIFVNCDEDAGLYELSVEDFDWYNPKEGDYDFVFNNDQNFVERDSIPEKVKDFLDREIREWYELDEQGEDDHCE